MKVLPNVQYVIYTEEGGVSEEWTVRSLGALIFRLKKKQAESEHDFSKRSCDHRITSHTSWLR